MFRHDEPSTDPAFGRHGDVLEWIAHPEERGLRASHAIPGSDGYWLVDPLLAPDLDEHLDDLGSVAGVVVCTQAHARDAGRIASRFDVPVTLPYGLDRAAERVDGPVNWVRDDLPDPAIDLHLLEPLPGWREAVLAFEDALYVPEVFGTAPQFRLDGERLGTSVFVRPVVPREPFVDYEPERLFFGHGRALTDGAPAALEDALENALENARRRSPRALVEHGPEQVRSFLTNIVFEE